METFSALLTLCVVTGEFPTQRPATQKFDVSFDLHLNKWLSKQSRRRLFKSPSRSLWRYCIVKGIISNPYSKTRMKTPARIAWQIIYVYMFKAVLDGEINTCFTK